MKIVSIDRELWIPITIIYVIIIALKVYNKKIRQKGEHFEKKKENKKLSRN